MCGFCGIMQEHGPVHEELVVKMREKMLHRGPDEGSNFLNDRVGMGFRRLKIIDLFTGRQPMSNGDGSLWLIYNGEIYNYLSLREELIKKGHKFSSRSDSEVILHLYEDRGTECLQSLRGMFAFVLWDKKRQRLFGARDRFGIKPFYYLEGPGFLAFASEIKALAEHPFFPREVDEGALTDYLTFQYVPEPRTMFSGVYRLPPAHYFLKSPGKPLEIRRYWQMQFKPSPEPLNYFLEGIREKLREAIRLHLASDVPRGAFLSSGVDSAIIAALARELEPISTFSVGYAEEHFSELQEARETAAFLETDHHEYIITPQEFLQLLPRLVWHFDEPVADPAAISLYFVARMAREKITVVLSGEGADEVFAGYGIYREPFALAPLHNLPRPLRQSLHLLEKFLPRGMPGKNYLARSRRPLEERFLGNAYIFSPAEKKHISRLNINPSPFRVTDSLYRQVADLDEVTRMQYIDLNTWMPGDILMKADKMTMANSLELRVPYLDHCVFEFAATLPQEYKVHGKTTKRALREAFRDILPPAAINRPKRGFPVPTREWMKRPDFRRLFLDLLAGKGGDWFQRNNVKGLLKGHLEGKVEASRKLWALLIFLLWHEIYNLKGAAK
ncbi:MAG: asparagine synthase (glutamine-hydrolyzing) [Dethiobacter sp.]|nr:MAG: asparagine synthase (glutamine-hydrolyzing) [Dethiobacter sp.]